MAVKWKIKRYVVLMIITALLWNMPIYVSAKEVPQSDKSDINKLTANVETDIYQVVMPTDTEGVFDFILDPQRLINETNGAMYKGKSFEKNCTVFFRRLDGEVKEDYSCKSDSVSITNKSTMPVEVSLEVKVDSSSLDGIVMTEDSTFKNDKSASLYLAILDGEKTVPVGKEGVTLHETIGAAPDGSYEYAYDSDVGKYEYRLKKNIEEKLFEKYSFQLIGAANEKGDWSAFTKAVPEILITWKVIPKENEVLRKDAIFRGKDAEIKSDDLEQENIPQDQEEETQAVKGADEAVTEEETAAVAIEDEKGAAIDDEGTEEEAQSSEDAGEDEKNAVTDEGESKEELPGQKEFDGEEKNDIDTEESVGE